MFCEQGRAPLVPLLSCITFRQRRTFFSTEFNEGAWKARQLNETPFCNGLRNLRRQPLRRSRFSINRDRLRSKVVKFKAND